MEEAEEAKNRRKKSGRRKSEMKQEGREGGGIKRDACNCATCDDHRRRGGRYESGVVQVERCGVLDERVEDEEGEATGSRARRVAR